MIYLISNALEAHQACSSLPKEIEEELIKACSILDEAYGDKRDYSSVGGYCIIATKGTDMPMLISLFDFDARLAEYSRRIADYIVSLYLLGDNYAILLFLPYDSIPLSILNKLQIEENLHHEHH